jgi:hypothetical protein
LGKILTIKNLSILELIVGVGLMVVVAIEDGIVHQFHFFLLLPAAALRQLLLRGLSLAQRRGVRSVHLVHEVSHQFLTETVQR